MHGSSKDFLLRISGFLGGYYLTLALMCAVAAFYLWHYKHRVTAAIVWTAVALVMVCMAPAALSGSPPGLPAWLEEAINGATGPVAYSVGTTSLLAILFIFRRFFVQPMVA